MSRPRTLNVRTTKEVPAKIKVRYVSDLRDDDGHKLDGCVTSANEILLEKDLLPMDRVSTLIHEVIHVAAPDLPEATVLRIEHAVFQAIKSELK